MAPAERMVQWCTRGAGAGGGAARRCRRLWPRIAVQHVHCLRSKGGGCVCVCVCACICVCLRVCASVDTAALPCVCSVLNCVLTASLLLTAGEDACCCVWDMTGKRIKRCVVERARWHMHTHTHACMNIRMFTNMCLVCLHCPVYMVCLMCDVRDVCDV